VLFLTTLRSSERATGCGLISLAVETPNSVVIHVHLTLHSFLSLVAMVVVRLHYQAVEVLHDVFELRLCGYDCFYKER
jgi:hypothetical protein